MDFFTHKSNMSNITKAPLANREEELHNRPCKKNVPTSRRNV